MSDDLGMAQFVVGPATEDWTGDAKLYEYSKAADPVGSGWISPVPVREFGPALYANGESRVMPLDLSQALNTPYPATSPALLAHFIRILAGDTVATHPNATSELYYVIAGRGKTVCHQQEISWQTGDFFTLPSGSDSRHTAVEDAALYYVVDTPILDFLGVTASHAKFRPTFFDGRVVREELRKVASLPDAARKSRVSVLLNNARFDQTLTVTHTLWAMYGVISPGEVQYPHCHKSVALDLAVDCEPGVYTLLGHRIDPETKAIIDPIRVDWEPGKAFVTPPGMWHSHHNESKIAAYILPVQDAGLQTYLRTLDIQFTFPD